MLNYVTTLGFGPRKLTVLFTRYVCIRRAQFRYALSRLQYRRSTKRGIFEFINLKTDLLYKWIVSYLFAEKFDIWN